MEDTHDQKHASRHGYTYMLHVYVLKTYICMPANANTKYMCTFTHTHCEGYMHMHAHLSIYSICQIFAFLIFIQCTKMLHELKIHYKKKHIKQCTSLTPDSIEI